MEPASDWAFPVTRVYAPAPQRPTGPSRGTTWRRWTVKALLAATAAATASIPPAMLTLYQSASTTCLGLPWTVLAAIGTIESDNGQSTLPGVHGGANSAGAVFTQNR